MVGEAVIAEAIRTPIGKRNGSLAAVHPADLTAVVLQELSSRTGLDPAAVDDVIWGCVTQIGDQSSNIGRFGVLAAGWPETVPAVTINRACGSSQQAIDQAAQAVMSGAVDMVVAGGVESMSRVPMGAARTYGLAYGKTVLGRYGVTGFAQGLSAEMLAQRWSLSRTVLDEFAAESHWKAAEAIDSGAFTGQVVRVALDGHTLSVDEGLRRATTVRTLSELEPSFLEGGVIHAGNSSQISDGAAAVLVTTPERARDSVSDRSFGTTARR